MDNKKWETHWFKWNNDESMKLWKSVLDNRERVDPAYKLIADKAKENGSSILDIACGGGVQAKKLLEHNIEYSGIDISESNIETAKKLFPKGNFKVGDAANLPFKDNTFDVTLIRHLIEHHPPENAIVILNEALRVAKNCLLILFFIPPKESGTEIKIKKAGSGVFLNIYTKEWLLNHIKIPTGYHISVDSIKIKKPNNKLVLTNQELYIIKKGKNQ